MPLTQAYALNVDVFSYTHRPMSFQHSNRRQGGMSAYPQDTDEAYWLNNSHTETYYGQDDAGELRDHRRDH